MNLTPEQRSRLFSLLLDVRYQTGPGAGALSEVLERVLEIIEDADDLEKREALKADVDAAYKASESARVVGPKHSGTAEGRGRWQGGNLVWDAVDWTM